MNDPASPWRPYRKVVHRASPDIVLVEGGHAVRSEALQPLRGWYPIECLHFPLRSPAQVERKGLAWGAAVEKFYATSEVARSAGTAYHALQHDAAVCGEAEAYYRALALGPDDVTRGIEAGLLEEDVRVRDALLALAERGGVGGLEFPRPTTIETASFAIDAAVLGEADVIRTQRWLDELERRVGRLERTMPVRVERRLRDLARKALRR